MKNITLTFAQRVSLIHLLSAQEGTLGRLAPYMRVLDVIRFSDGDDKEIIRRPVDASRMSYEAPHPGFGALTATIEEGDATALCELFNTWPRFTAQDGAWATPILEALQAKKAQA